MKSTKFIIAILIALGLSIIFYIYLLEQKPQQKQLPVISTITPFQLTDCQNKPFSTDTLKGKIWIAHFFFTTCSGVCPITTGQLASIFRSYDLDDRVHFVSITVNPDNDTPDVLKNYAKRYKADLNQWHFLTGSLDKIENITTKNFKVGTVGEPVFHSSYFVLVDRLGQIRNYYDGLDRQQTAKLFRDISTLLNEK